MRGKVVKRKTKTAGKVDDGAESDMMMEDLESRGKYTTELHKIDDEKNYMKIEELSAGDIRVSLFMPPYDIVDL